jgi:hypothetical protein
LVDYFVPLSKGFNEVATKQKYLLLDMLEMFDHASRYIYTEDDVDVKP